MKPGFKTKGLTLVLALLMPVALLCAESLSPLCFTAKNGTVSVKFTVRNVSNNVMQYGINDSTWFNYPSDSVITLNSGESVYFRAATDKTAATAIAFGSNGSISPSFTFTSTDGGTIEATGNIMSLYGPGCPDIELPDYAFRSMFAGCGLLTSAPQLPATQLGKGCYEQMFMGCSKLTAAPLLPAIELAEECYSYMFFGCSRLTSAPMLPATTIAKRCYMQMFSQCSSLQSAPLLPALKMEESCYEGMFADCSSLMTATMLGADTMAVKSYYGMFMNCSSLVAAPELPATVLADNCYGLMFCNCVSLTTIPQLPADSLPAGCYYYMFANCSSVKMNNAAPGIEWIIAADNVGANALDDMFMGTKGTMNGTPAVNITYYFVPIKVTANVNDTVMGNVSISGNNSYGNIVTLTATRKPHYHFVGWSNGKTSFVITVTVYGDSVLTAYFAPDPHNVTATVNDTTMGSVTGAGEYGYGTTATLIAEPMAHHHLVGWSNGKTTDTIQIQVYGDSTITAIFALNPTYLIEESDTICQGDTLTWRMQKHTLAGVYYDSLTTQYGEDSVYQLTLTVNPTYLIQERDSVCQGDSLIWHERTLKVAGIYYDSLHTVAGCDSVYELALIVNPVYFFAETDTICHGDTLTWHGQSLTTAGIYYDSLASKSGCDSVYQLTLSLNPSYIFRKSQTICQGGNYRWRKKDYNAAGVYYDSLKTELGCDSIYELTLTLNPTYLIQEQDSVCQGDSLIWHGRTLKVAGIYYDSLLTGLGCDSVHQLTLTVNPVYYFAVTDTICQGDTLIWHGQSLTTAGVYYDTLVTRFGCDSIYQLTLSLNPSYIFRKSYTICQGGSYRWRKKNYSVAGVYYDSLKSTLGCDSVYQLTLTVNPTYLIQEQDSVCQGDSLIWHGRTLSVAGIYYDSLLTGLGCDSVHQLALTVNPVYYFAVTDTICQGDTLKWHGQSLTTAGVYYDSLVTVFGCDSIYQLTLALNPSYLTCKSKTICQGDVYRWRKKNYTVDGVYYDSLQTQLGCDSVFKLTLTVKRTYLFQDSDTICKGDKYIWRGGTYTVSGVYYDSLISVDGCDSVFELTLTVNDRYYIKENQKLCGSPITWHNRTINAVDVYYDSLVSVTGCDSVYELTVTRDRYLITVLANDDVSGRAYINDGGVRAKGIFVNCGDTVEIHAVANAHYHFEQWSDGATDTVRYIIVTSDTILQARFIDNCGDWADWPAYLLYNGLIILNLDQVKAYGYFPEENEVKWYKVVDQPDIVDWSFPQDDEYICMGYYLSLSQYPMGDGDYYAMADVSDDVDVPCHYLMRTVIVPYAVNGQKTRVEIAPTEVGTGSIVTVSGLNPEERYLLAITDLSGRVVEMSETTGSERYEINAHYPAGVYFVRINSETTKETVKFIITK